MKQEFANLKKLRSLTGAERLRMIEEYRSEREQLFKEYIGIQDLIEEYNEKVNQITCRIEKLNILLTEMGVDLSK